MEAMEFYTARFSWVLSGRAASADLSSRLGRGERSRSVYGRQILTVAKTHAPYL